MRKHGLIPVFIFFILTACDYDAPLVGEASLPIDQAVLGTWELIPDDQAGQESTVRAVIRQESGNEYAIEYIDDESIIYFRGWLAELEEIHFVQLEVTGTNKGPVDAKYTDPFGVLSYTLDNGKLVIRPLNTALVNKALADTSALQAAFAANRNDPNLFHDPGQFRKLTDESDEFPEK